MSRGWIVLIFINLGLAYEFGKGEELMGKVVLSASREAQDLVKAIEAASGTRTSLCYQCGKCTAGCPVNFAMDYPPRQIIRLLQLGLVEEALQAKSIWVCASCDTCTARCPRGVDIASIMDALRREALGRGRVFRDVSAFNQSFLNGVKRFGRVHEASMVVEYNTRNMKLLKNAEQGPLMLSKGKLNILPEPIKGRKEVSRIFDKVKEMEGDHQ